MSRGKIEVRNPAEAVAISKCWLAGWSEGVPGVPSASEFHPKRCDWCDYPRDLLIQALEEFITWAHLRTTAEDRYPDSNEAPLRLELESWATLPADEQLRLVIQAQGYDDKTAGEIQYQEHLKQRRPVWWNEY